MNAISPASGCTAGTLSFEAALARVLSLAPTSLRVEDVPLDACSGRVLGETVRAAADLPGFDQSAMDGYAVRGADLSPGAWLTISGRTAAGEPPGQLASGCAHRVLTGAPIPQGADAVIAQERVEHRDGTIRIGVVPPHGSHIRRHGEDISAGTTLVAAGTVLDWRHIALLAAQGVATIRVRRRPVVALLSSGRELRAPGKGLAAGQIHDSNLPMLAALLDGCGAEVRRFPIVADTADAMRAALREAAKATDLVLTTAGISVGDEDHVRDALHDLDGDLAVLSVAMKPGKPLAAGRLGGAAFIGLPGNPQAALAGAIAFVRPLLARIAGTAIAGPRKAWAGFSMERNPGRTEFLPVRLRQQGACVWAERTGPDGSGRLAPLAAATGLAMLPPGATLIERASLLDILPFFTDGL